MLSLRKNFVWFFIAFVIFSSVFSIFFHQTEWPFHSMDMFASYPKFKHEITFIDSEGIEQPLYKLIGSPFGYWRSRILAVRIIEMVDTDLERTLRMLKFIWDNQSAEMKAKEIRVYHLLQDKSRELVARVPNL